MLSKPISDISYEDIKQLKVDCVEESDIIDYKREFSPDDSYLKHICAFANTRGGYLIFGVTEEGDGGPPTEINGIARDVINKEAIVNKILAHITPRLNVEMKAISIPNNEKSILIIHIPDSYMRPHYNKDFRYYKRFHRRTAIMTELEIADLYKKRFSNQDQVNQYIEKILFNETPAGITGNIVIIPTNIEHRLVNTFNREKITSIDEISLTSYNNDHGASIAPCAPSPSSHGLTHTRKSSHGTISHELHIHRNGCIHLHKIFAFIYDDRSLLDVKDLAIRLMELLEFACIILRRHNYYGELKIVMTLIGPTNTVIPGVNYERTYENKLNVNIVRECPLEYIEQHREDVAASIMHEVVNYYGVVRCSLFDENDNWK